MNIPHEPRIKKTVVLHPYSGFDWGSPDEIAPGFGIEVKDDAGNPKDSFVLRFDDPDGRSDVFLFSEEGRLNLIEHLTGGITVPRAAGIVTP